MCTDCIGTRTVLEREQVENVIRVITKGVAITSGPGSCSACQTPTVVHRLA